jgi:hypothetical protein
LCPLVLSKIRVDAVRRAEEPLATAGMHDVMPHLGHGDEECNLVCFGRLVATDVPGQSASLFLQPGRVHQGFPDVLGGGRNDDGAGDGVVSHDVSFEMSATM